MNASEESRLIITCEAGPNRSVVQDDSRSYHENESVAQYSNPVPGRADFRGNSGLGCAKTHRAGSLGKQNENRPLLGQKSPSPLHGAGHRRGHLTRRLSRCAILATDVVARPVSRVRHDGVAGDQAVLDRRRSREAKQHREPTSRPVAAVALGRVPR